MNICLYGASSDDIAPGYIAHAEAFGKELARRGHTLVFGGGAHGLMGAAARGAHEIGGGIIGIAPRFFDVGDILYQSCTDFIFTETMRERKQLMEEHSDAFVVAPGGIGTFEEFFEILTLKQLGRHGKPIAILNTDGYYCELIAMIDAAISKGFMKPACRDLLGVFTDISELLDYIESDNGELADAHALKGI